MESVFHTREVETEFATVRMEDLSPKEAYNVLVSAISPRPIAFVSTVSLTGVANLAPFSFFVAGGANPPSLVFSPVLNADGGEKDSLRNVRETGEFVVNIVHRPMAEGMNRTSAPLLPHESEWEPSGFTALRSVLVGPPRVAESLVQFECRLFSIVEHGAGPTAARYIIGEVLLAHVAPSLMEAGRIQGDRIRPIARMGGPNYVDTEALELFRLDRPV